jgi:uncharacterized membrane protein
MTNEQHNKYLGIAFLIHGGFQLLITLLMVVVFGSAVAVMPNQPDGPPPAFFMIIFTFVVLFQSIFALPSFVAAYAVLKRKSWARIASIIAAVLSAMSVPIGTATCVYALWFFLGENWKEIYQPASVGGAHGQLSGHDAAEWTTNQSREATRQRVPPPPPDWR